jgi:Zn-dependent protease
VFGITVRVHLLFPLVAIGLIMRAYFKGGPGVWIDATMVTGLLFVVVLLHEFGHCFGARLVDGDATDILMWPLGGLAYAEVPHTPRAHFVTAAGGPAVNLVICLLSALLLLVVTPPEGPVQPAWNPFRADWYPYRIDAEGAVRLFTWAGGEIKTSHLGTVVLARLFWVSWFLFLLNLLPGFPLDGGRLFQCVLWPYLGFRQSMVVALFAGFVTAVLIAIAAIVWNEEVSGMMALCLAAFIFITCWRQRILLETGAEESLFGYDFSQGYTSLERDQPPPRRRQSWWQRWLQRRAAKKLQREQEQREADERRMDELLEKIQREGKQALTEEETRFLKRVSDKYRRNRH